MVKYWILAISALMVTTTGMCQTQQAKADLTSCSTHLKKAIKKVANAEIATDMVTANDKQSVKQAIVWQQKAFITYQQQYSDSITTDALILQKSTDWYRERWPNE